MVKVTVAWKAHKARWKCRLQKVLSKRDTHTGYEKEKKGGLDGRRITLLTTLCIILNVLYL